MANTVNITKWQDGPSDVIYHVYLASDGNAGDLTNQVIIDPNDLTDGNDLSPFVPPGSPPGPCFNIQQVIYNLSGFDIAVNFGGTPPTPVMLLTPSVDSAFDFRPFGGIADRTPPANSPNGDLTITTKGFTTTNCTGFFIIKVRKMK